MVTRNHFRNTEFALPDGTVPLAKGDRYNWTNGASLTRTRAMLELYVEAVSSTGNLINFAAMTTTRCAFGIIVYDTLLEQGSTTFPLTDPNTSAGRDGWAAWEPAFPTIDYFKESDVETAVWTYRSNPITFDVQTRRATTPGNSPTVWWAYEIKEDSGSSFINQTVSGTTYALGYRIYTDYFLETF